MKIKHDHSYISSSDMEFVNRGYGCERVRSLRFSFVYMEAQQEANRAKNQGIDLSSPEWAAVVNEAAKMKSEHMARVMEAIGAKHWCYQYNQDRDLELFKSDDWDLFFWCNSFYTSTRGALSGRDYSYFTLNFNEAQSAEKQKAVYDSVMEILAQFQGDENIEVAVQYEIALDDAKIKEMAATVASNLVGKRTTYSPSGGVILFPGFDMEGRIVEANGKLFFMKKRARNKGYLLSDKEILKIFWSLAG